MKKQSAARAEIKRRYRSKIVSLGPLIATRRIADLETLFASRYGGKSIPDDDAGHGDIEIIANHFGELSEGWYLLARWLAKWAKWADDDRIDCFIQSAKTKRRRWRADTLARRLGVTDAERTKLGITTIGSIDVPRSERAERRRENKRKAQEKRRRASGAVPRKHYENNSVNRRKPWLAVPCSRATWFRRQKCRVECSETSPCPT